MAIDILTIEGNRVSRDLRGKYLLLYGNPKVGKTTFGAQMPKSLILAFERGYNALPGVKAIDILSWSDLKQVVSQLRKPEAKEMYNTIVIDTVGIAGDLAEQYVCAQNGVSSIGQVPYGQGWGLLSREMDKTFRSITMMGYGLVFLAHSKTRNLGTMENEILAYSPDMSKRTKSVVNGLVDVIGYIHQHFNDKGESERFIYTRETPLIEAGSRFKSLDAVIPFSYENVVDAIADAIEKDAGNTGFVTDDSILLPDVTVEKRPFRELQEEARVLWEKIVLDDNEEIIDEQAQAVENIIVEVFGKPYRLSEIGPLQQDFFEEVLRKLNIYLAELKDRVKEIE